MFVVFLAGTEGGWNIKIYAWLAEAFVKANEYQVSACVSAYGRAPFIVSYSLPKMHMNKTCFHWNFPAIFCFITVQKSRKRFISNLMYNMIVNLRWWWEPNLHIE